MSAGRLLVALVLAVVVAGCQSAVPPTASTEATSAPPPTQDPVVEQPTAPPDPCPIAVTRVGTFSFRVGNALAELRPLVLSESFDAVKTLSKARHVSSLLSANEDLLEVVNRCPATQVLAGRVDRFLEKANAAIAASLAAGFEKNGQRAAAVSLFKTVRRVGRISDANAVIAGVMGVQVQTLLLLPETVAKLGKLPPIDGSKPAPETEE